MSLKVYYVDDESELLVMFQDTFMTPEIKIDIFQNTDLALAKIKSDPPDLLFLDFRMFGMTGDELAAKVDPLIPKVLITGDLLTKNSQPYLQIIRKPYEEDDILNIFKLVLAKKETTLIKLFSTSSSE